MHPDVTVAIPVLNGGTRLEQVLAAVSGQRYAGAVQLLVCDSGSRDGSPALAAAHGAEVITIAPDSFGHGRTRNLLMQRSGGTHVAFLTQDAVPADEHWLARLVEAFDEAAGTGLSYGPYRARADASLMVARELEAWFARISPDGAPRVDEPDRPADGADGAGARPAAFLGARGYFTDANGCVLRAAWQQIPFRDVSYAEDHLLAQDMLRAGFAKVFVPGAAVVHSHDYRLSQWVRRSFDESRAMREIYGVSPAGDPRAAIRTLRGNVGADLRWTDGRPGAAASTPIARARLLAASTLHHGARGLGAVLGGHPQWLPGRVRAQLSLESRR